MENHEICSKVIAKAWSDPKFKQQLLTNPSDALHALGIEIPHGTKVTVCENTEKEIFLVLPQKPASMTEEQLESIAAGASVGEEALKLFGGFVLGKFIDQIGKK